MYGEDWVHAFCKKAGPRLQQAFETDLDELPPMLAALLCDLEISEKIELPLAA